MFTVLYGTVFLNFIFLSAFSITIPLSACDQVTNFFNFFNFPGMSVVELRMVGRLLFLSTLWSLVAADIRLRHPVAGSRVGQPVTELVANPPQAVTEHFSRVQPGLIGGH